MDNGELLFRSRHEEPVPPEHQEVYDFIDDLKTALADAKDYLESPTPAKEEAIRQKVVDLRQRSGFGGLRYPIKIRIPDGVKAETSLGEYIPDAVVTEDTITSLSEIRLDHVQVEFYSDHTIEGHRPHWLTVYSYDLEDIKPVFE